MADPERLSALDGDGHVHVVVEASRGMRAKCKYDSELGLFVFGKPLPHGMAYPFDWGFIPSTKGEDGDPLDALVLHDAACPVGCLIACKPVAVLRVLQTEKGRKKRNDRFLLRPAADKAVSNDTLSGRLKREMEQFFRGVVLDTGKTLEFGPWQGPKQALAAIRKGMRAA